jgi:hypothetical protein
MNGGEVAASFHKQCQSIGGNMSTLSNVTDSTRISTEQSTENQDSAAPLSASKEKGSLRQLRSKTQELLPKINLDDLVVSSSRHSYSDITGKHKKSKKASNTITIITQKAPAEPEELSEEFIKKYNDHIGSDVSHEKAIRHLHKMQALGGLTEKDESKQNIPAARRGLAILAQVKDQKIKLEALKSLQIILERDPLTSESAEGIVALVIHFLDAMNRELIQLEVVEIQIQVAKTYSAIAELLIHQYVAENINAITDVLKAKLADATKELKALNRLNNVKLSYYAGTALEGINRLKDDKNKLFEIMQRSGHGVLAGASLAAYARGMGTGQPDGGSIDIFARQIAAVTKGIHLYKTNDWYDEFIFLHRTCVTTGKKHLKSLEMIQHRVAEKHQKFNWRFLYGSLKLLTDIVINGETEDIRERAYSGNTMISEVFPALASYAGIKSLPKTLDAAPLKYLEAPQLKDPNGILRLCCIECLALINKECPDRIIRKQALEDLKGRLAEETDLGIKELLSRTIAASIAESESHEKEGAHDHSSVSHEHSKPKNPKHGSQQRSEGRHQSHSASQSMTSPTMQLKNKRLSVNGLKDMAESTSADSAP